MLGQTARLIYLYMGSADVARDLAFYRDQLGGRVVWHARAEDAEVVAIELGDGPLLLLADHGPTPGVSLLWAVEDLEAAVATLKQAGWSGPERRIEVPDGPILLLSDHSGNRLGLLEQVRPDAMLKDKRRVTDTSLE